MFQKIHGVIGEFKEHLWIYLYNGFRPKIKSYQFYLLPVVYVELDHGTQYIEITIGWLFLTLKIVIHSKH